MSNIFRKNKEKIIFVVFFLVNLLILILSNFKDGGDDLFYKNAALNYQAVNFVTTRYMEWTGRILPEFLGYLFNERWVIFWPAVNASIITLLSILIYKYLNIYKNLNQNKKIFLALITCLSFLLIERSVIRSAVVWRTGSINYLWPVTLGFLCFYPFLKSFKNELDKNHFVFYFLISFLAAISMEQVSVVLIVGAITYFGFMAINKKKIPKIIYLMSINILIGSLILFLAPGNQIRFQQEAAHNFPEFLSLGVFNRISISLYWIFNKLVNVMPLVLVPIYLILGIKNLKNSNKIIGLISLILVLILLIKSVLQIEYNVYPITSDNINSLALLSSYVLMFSAVFLIPFQIWKLYKTSKKTIFYILILLTIFLLMVMITLSPTLDVSGNRTVFLPSVLINVLGLLLITESPENRSKKKALN